MQTTSHPPMHVLTRIGVGVVFLAFVGILAANVFGWINTLPGALGQVMAFVGVICAVFAFVAVPHVEKHWRSKDWPRFWVMLAFLLGAVVVDFIGVERGVAYYFNTETTRQQSAAYTQAYSGLQSEIEALQSRIEAAPAPDLSGGPQNDAQAIAARESIVAPLRDQLNAKLDAQQALPRPEQPSTPLVAYVLATLAEAIVTLGLFAFGWEIPGTQLSPRKRERNGDNVVDFHEERSKRSSRNAPTGTDLETIRRLKSENVPLREIGKQFNVSHTTIRRWLKAS